MIVYFEGAPYSGKSTLIKQIKGHHPEAIVASTESVRYSTLLTRGYLMQVASFGTQMSNLALARNNTDEIFLASRSFYSAKIFGTEGGRAEPTIGMMVREWEEAAYGVGAIILLDTPLSVLKDRWSEDRASGTGREDRRRISLTDLYTYHERYKPLRWTNGSKAIPVDVASYPFSEADVWQAIKGLENLVR